MPSLRYDQPLAERLCFAKQNKKGGKGGVHDLSDETPPSCPMNFESLGSFTLCDFSCGSSGGCARAGFTLSSGCDRARSTPAGSLNSFDDVDSAACVTAVPVDHKAVRGYRTWSDRLYGRDYTTANNAKVKDEGLRVARRLSCFALERLRSRDRSLQLPILWTQTRQ